MINLPSHPRSLNHDCLRCVNSYLSHLQLIRCGDYGENISKFSGISEKIQGICYIIRWNNARRCLYLSNSKFFTVLSNIVRENCGFMCSVGHLSVCLYVCYPRSMIDERERVERHPEVRKSTLFILFETLSQNLVWNSVSFIVIQLIDSFVWTV